MTTMQVCRTCLAHDTRMYTISNTPLLEYYEKITDLPANTQDGRPLVMCYICYHLLKKCCRFTAGAIKANEVLLQVSKYGIEITKQYVTMIDKKMLLTLCKMPVTHLDVSTRVSESIEIPSCMGFEIKTKKEPDDLAEDTTTLSEDIAQHYEIKKEKIEIGDTEFQTSFISEYDDNVPLKLLCEEQYYTTAKDASNPNDDGRGNKDGVPNMLNQKQTTRERLKRILSSRQEKKKKDTPGPKNRKLDQTIQYPKSLPKQTSSRKNTVPEKTSEIETYNSKGFTEANVKCSDNGHTQLYLTPKTDSEKQFHQSNGEIRDNVKKESDNSYLNDSDKVRICNKTTDEQKFICDYCGDEFTRKHFLKYHLKIHIDVKPFKCIQCGKKFTHSGHVKTHLRIHTGEKPFTCIHCGKKFTQKGSMQKHLRIHTGENPFTCSHCGKKFTRMDNMRLHILRTHKGGDNPFTCSQCGKKFSSKENLLCHLKIHTGEKPFT